MDKSQKISNPEWNMATAKNLPAPKQNIRNPKMSTSILKFYAEKYVSVCSHDETAFIGGTREEQCAMLGIVKNSATVRETDMPFSTHLSQRQSFSKNTCIMSLCMKQQIRNQLSHQLSNLHGHLFMLEKSIS
jgi:hypothetical protein